MYVVITFYYMTTKENLINPTGYKQRTYNVDDFFFNIPNELNSYYAGFIAADGNIRSVPMNTQRIQVPIYDQAYLIPILATPITIYEF